MLRLLLLLVALFTGWAHGAPPVEAVQVLSAEFGIFDASTPGELAFEVTDVVPHRLGQRYGWVIEVRTQKRNLSVSEAYVLQKQTAGATDLLAEGLNLAPVPRSNQVSLRLLAPVDGKIYGEWSVGPQEPAGHRHLQVFIEDRLAASFEFDVK